MTVHKIDHSYWTFIFIENEVQLFNFLFWKYKKNGRLIIFMDVKINCLLFFVATIFVAALRMSKNKPI